MCRLLESSRAYFSCVRFWRRRKSLCWKRDLGACAFTQKSLATTRLKTRFLLLRETCTQVQTKLFPMHVHWSTGTGNGRKPTAFSSAPTGFQSEAIYKAHVANGMATAGNPQRFPRLQSDSNRKPSTKPTWRVRDVDIVI